MSKTVTEIMKTVGLPEGQRNGLLKRIKDKYKKNPLSFRYRKIFSEADFKYIVEKEKYRKSIGYLSGDFTTRDKSIYFINSNRRLYSRLTEYEGLT